MEGQSASWARPRWTLPGLRVDAWMLGSRWTWMPGTMRREPCWSKRLDNFFMIFWWMDFQHFSTHSHDFLAVSQSFVGPFWKNTWVVDELMRHVFVRQVAWWRIAPVLPIPWVLDPFVPPMVWSILSCHWAAITNARQCELGLWVLSTHWHELAILFLVIISVIWLLAPRCHCWITGPLPFLSIQIATLPGSRFWPRPMLHSSIRSRMVFTRHTQGKWNLPAPTGNGRTRRCWSDTYVLAMIHGGLPRKRCECLSDIGPYDMSCPRQQRARSQ